MTTTTTTKDQPKVLGMLPLELFTVGAWACVLLATAYYTRSGNAMLQSLKFGAVMVLPVFMFRWTDSPAIALRWLSRTVLLTYALLVLVGMLGMVERILMESRDRYPRWLLTGELPADAMDERGILKPEVMDSFGECRKDGPVEIITEPGGYLVRCGYAWYYPSTKTYFLPSKSAAGTGEGK